MGGLEGNLRKWGKTENEEMRKVRHRHLGQPWDGMEEPPLVRERPACKEGDVPGSPASWAAKGRQETRQEMGLGFPGTPGPVLKHNEVY